MKLEGANTWESSPSNAHGFSDLQKDLNFQRLNHNLEK